MRILVKKALRDLGRSRLRTISIISAIALSVGLGISLVNATKDALESFDKRLEITNYEDIDIEFDMTNISIEDIRAVEGVREAIGRILLKPQSSVGGEKYRTHWIASPHYDERPYSGINGVQLSDGKYVSSPLARECLIGNLFSKENSAGVGEKVELFYSDLSLELEVVGVAASPEYIYVVGEGGWPEPSLLLPLFTTYELACEVLGLEEGTYNEVLITVEEGYDPGKVKEDVEGILTGSGVRISRSLLGTEEMDYQFSRTDAKAMGQMGWIFGVIILVVTAVVIYNSLTRLIASQRTYIGVMEAVGGRMTDILLHYTLFGFTLGLAGSVIGIPLGVGISAGVMYVYSDLIGLISPVYTIYWTYPLIFAGIGILISTLGALFGALNIIRIGPREALHSQYQAQDYSRKPIVERLFDKVAYRRPIIYRIPLRNLGRHRIRTLVTVVSLAASLLLVFSCLTLFMGFTQPLEKNYDDYERWDLKADLTSPVPRGAAEDRISSGPLRGTNAELMIDDYVPIRQGDEMRFVRVQAFDKESDLRSFHVIEGVNRPGEGVLVGSILAKEIGVDVGEEIIFVLGNETTRAEVMGITGELMDDSILMTMELADELQLSEGTANSIVLDLGEMSKEEVETLLREEFEVSSLMYTEDVVNGMESMLQGILTMFLLFILLGVIAEVLFISTTVVLNILDRETEFISLRAIGAKPGKIRRLIMAESLILLAGGLLVGLPLGVLVTKQAMAYMVEDLMYYVLEVPLTVYIYTSLIAVFSALGAAYVSARWVTKSDLSGTIRNRLAG